jgi:pimeloyl-ACP methyl ester carboxylesterase
MEGAAMIRFLLKAALLLAVLVALALIGFRIAAHQREDVAWPPDELPGRLVDTDLGRIHVLEAGPQDGVPVLLIHGSVGWGGLWADTLDVLGDAGYRAIAPDLPPMGYSERRPEDDYARPAQAARLVALAEALSVKPIIVAHSFGAGAGTEAAMSAPEAFSGLVIINGALGLDSRAAAMPQPLRSKVLREAAVSATVTNPLLTGTLLKQFVFRRESVTEDRLRVIRAPFVIEGTTGALAQWLPTLLVRAEGALSAERESYRQLGLPTAIIWGAEDTTTPLAQGEELAALIPGAQLTVLPDVGHIPQIEDPPAFHAALLAALAGLVAEGP